MSDKLENAVAELLIKVASGAESAGEFILSELPDVVQQLLAWEVFVSLLWFAVTASISVYLFVIFKKSRKSANEDDNNIDAMFASGFSFGGLVLFSLAAVINLQNAAKIWIAPKLFILEYAASLAK